MKNLNSKGRLMVTALAIMAIFLTVLAISATLNTQIPDQILPVNSSSELDLSAYFPEFPDNVWFSAS